ncbi:hypothetical protein GXW82_08220 [Streptacidiphilus sp. 4-A2]|nr:hypothetical protein [Streptacidiphilus sp. 4-A2]
MLEAFGVGRTAEAVYLAMLHRPEAGPDELALCLGLSADTVHGALDELALLALLRPSLEDPLTLRPVTPELGLESLLARQQAELLSRQHRIEQGRAALEVIRAEQAGRRDGTAADIEELVGPDAVRDRLELLTSQTRFEVLSFCPEGAHTEDARTAARPLHEQVLDRGVRVRSLYLDSIHNDPGNIGYARWLAESGGEVRTTATLPLRLVIVDRETAVVPLDPEASDTGAVVLHSAGAVAGLYALFEQTWAAATPLGNCRERDETGLTQQEKALLRLFAEGDTDEVAARKLGVSDRTVRRLTADIMGQLGTRSRFQAGVRAAERGWLGSGRRDHRPPGSTPAGSTRPVPTAGGRRRPTRPRRGTAALRRCTGSKRLTNRYRATSPELSGRWGSPWARSGSRSPGISAGRCSRDCAATGGCARRTPPGSRS